MFRKVQLKFFGIITSILLAIFIAVLSSITIIMDTVMEHQTKVVLEQVAAGVEYDASNAQSPFTFIRPDNDRYKWFDEPVRTEPPTKPKTTAPAVKETTTAETTAYETTTTAAAEVTEAQPAATQSAAPEKTSVPTAPATTTKPAPQQTTATTKSPDRPDNGHKDDDHNKEDTTQPPTEEDQKPTQPSSDPWGGNFPPYPGWGWGWGWGWDRYDYNWNEGLTPTANFAYVPVLDGYTVITADEEPDKARETLIPDDKPPEKPFADQTFDQREREPVPKSLGSIDFFIIMADEEGKYLAALNNNDMTKEVAQQYITEILDNKATSGMANNYQFCTEKKTNGTLMVFTDKSAEMDMMKKLKRITFTVGMISVVVLSAAAYFLSGLIVRPIKVAFDKQKQFISDASHELKTPLTVISANADVLAGEIGENKWLDYIQDQTDRMNVLVNDLLNLTRLENNTTDFIQTEFDLSKAINSTALPFECQAFETGKKFIMHVDDGIRVVGSEHHIKQMAAIFIDNALKYSKENGTVRVTLTTENGKPVFSVYNTGKGIKEDEEDKIFERFYRSDASRNRSTGGYGLGLAIAKTIIDKHKFKVTVDNAEGKSVCFIVTMG